MRTKLISCSSRHLIAFFLGVFLTVHIPNSLSQETSSSISFTPDDRVLVMAPHPDDETIGAAGVIQQALKAGSKVKICLFTNGENNEFAFIVYEKRLVMKPREFIRLGQLRHQETLDAMKVLGVAPQDIVTLGYPDYGTMDVFLKYWGEKKYFHSMLSRVWSVPYNDALSPKAPYVGWSVLADMERLIREFRPTKIFVSHPGDVNRDHRALYLFTRVALWNLENEGAIQPPNLFPFIIHVVGWPIPRGYHPELPLIIPQDHHRRDIRWIVQPLGQEELARKHEAILKYPSQINYAPHYLVTFARRNELFGDYYPLPLVKQMASDNELVWSSVDLEDPPSTRIAGVADDHFSCLAYARQGNYLLVKVGFKRALDKELGLTIHLFGYNPKAPFAQMPKITLLYGIGGFFIKDKKSSLSNKDVIVQEREKELVFKVPLSMLGDPTLLLSCAKTALYDLSIDETPWRVVELK